MGLINVVGAAIGSASGVFADQWKEFFYCDALPSDVILELGQKKVKGNRNRGNDNIISNGSTIAVADGQCMIIVEQGKVVDYCAQPGEYVYDKSTEPSLLDGGKLSENIKAVFSTIGRRFTYAGETAKEQRVYYFNTKEIPENKYGTPSPVPFRLVDSRAGIDIDFGVRCFGEYSFKVTNPVLFYTNVSGNVAHTYRKSEIDGMMKTELLTALQPAFAKISAMGIRYSQLPGHATELAELLNEELSAKWKDLRGIEIISFGVSSITVDEEDEKMIKEMQKAAAYKDPGMAAAYMVSSQGEAMKTAAANAGGAAVGLMGMGMVQNAGGVNVQSLYQQAASQQASVSSGSWTCSCGTVNTGNFCTNCGAKNPNGPWTCSCGTTNTGKFCSNCGAKKPE